MYISIKCIKCVNAVEFRYSIKPVICENNSKWVFYAQNRIYSFFLWFQFGMVRLGSVQESNLYINIFSVCIYMCLCAYVLDRWRSISMNGHFYSLSRTLNCTEFPIPNCSAKIILNQEWNEEKCGSVCVCVELI